jgi:4-hydroxybenzoyl-CoA thioesterase
MFTNRRTVRIEWGDCDPAGIVFYPRYFAMFNHSTELVVEAALGVNKQALFATHDFAGFPVIETRARFLIPTRYCDDVVIETSITEVRRSSFHLQHRLSKDGALAVEGLESRVWVGRDPARPGRLKAQPIPPEIVTRLTGSATAPA